MRDLTYREIVKLVGELFVTGYSLQRRQYWPLEQTRAWQLTKIKELVAHAYRNTSFYRELYTGVGFKPEDLRTWEDFYQLPIVTKEQVISNYPERIVASGYSLNNLIVSRSSGSSGKVLDIAYDEKAMTFYILAALRLYKMCFNYRPWHKQVYIYTSPYPFSSLCGAFPLHFIHTLTPIPEIIAELLRVKPDLIVCYPSHLRSIGQQATTEERRGFRPKAISVNSEMSTQAERDALSDLFGCPVFDEYSSEELTRIAAQCNCGTYHIFEDVNFIETVSTEREPGAMPQVIVGTNLHNYAMPMIRYRQGDLGEIQEYSCGCKRNFRRLVNFVGRQNDSFLLPSGKILSSGFLLDATYEFLLNFRDAVSDFCLIQSSVTEVKLQLVPQPGWSEEISEKISARFREFLEPEVSFRIEIVKECTKTKTGKRNPIINQMKPQR